jgi:hypothetical protein
VRDVDGPHFGWTLKGVRVPPVDRPASDLLWRIG